MGEAELGVAGRADVRPERRLLHLDRLAAHVLQRAPAAAGGPVEQRSADPRDHRDAPRTAARRRAWVSSSQSSTRALKISGCSSIGA